MIPAGGPMPSLVAGATEVEQRPDRRPGPYDDPSVTREAALRVTRRRERRSALPHGRWPWWGWAVYAATLGPLLLIAAVPVAALRLLTEHPVWIFQRRRTALVYLLAAGLLIATTGLLVSGQRPSLPLRQVAGARDPATASTPAVPVAPGSAGATDGLGDAAGVQSAPGAQRATSEPSGRGAEAAGAASSEGLPAEPGPGVSAPAAETRSPTAAPTAPPTAAPARAPAVTPLAQRVAVGNTGGEGVSLRRSARWTDRWPGVAWPDRTLLTVLEHGVSGDDGAGGVTAWLRVRDPAGREGYVPARFTIPAG
jgi:hypothetical protein